jgi:hypothetical protein
MLCPSQNAMYFQFSLPCKEIQETQKLPATVAGLRLLVLVLKLRSEDCACYGAHDAMTAHLVAAEVASCTTTESTHQASVALSLGVWVAWSVTWRTWLAILRVMLLALGILVGWVCALLRELVLWLCTWVTALLLLAIVSGKISISSLETS